MDRLDVATLNLRNLADRWSERLPLLLADVGALRPDLLGLQEVVYPMQQDRLLGAASDDEYAVVRGWAGRPEYGNAILVKQPRAHHGIERTDLGHNRSATRIRVPLAGGTLLVFAVTHLHHLPDEPEIRDEQAGQLVTWLGEEPPGGQVQVLVGDFNAAPHEPSYARLRAAGFRSAHVEANGVEPQVTWPSGLQAPAMDVEGPPACLDYVWIRGTVQVEAARLFANRPAADDPTLFPSDHFGVTARLVVS